MKKGEHNKRGFFEEFFLPHYDELSLFSISYVCTLLFLVNIKSFSLENTEFTVSYDAFLLAMLCLILLSGYLLSFYHAFTDRRKTLIEKKLMLVYAAIVCGFSGIWSGTYMLVESPNMLIVFPIWNIISGWILLGALREGSLTEENVGDENVRFGQVASNTIIISCVFFFCYIFLKLNWAATFSICLVWVTTLNGSINQVSMKERIKNNQV